ncbi:MAG TPA: NADH-quinone oxidoreductase subunit L [Balneolaceae bacterium]|nr:NADH-quinone oxidoreductase subunit L [Balneolaceae bacterium]
MESPTALLSLIIGLPLFGFLLNGLSGLFLHGYREKKSLIGAIANFAVFIPFLLVLYLFINFVPDAGAVQVKLFTWINTGGFSVDIAYQVDQLSLIMALVVTGVGSLIHYYALGYMAEDPGFWKFFAYLNLFIFAMLNLILANNLLLLFLGWEGVGLCSYLLIGFWYRNMKNAVAAKKAFIYNRVGDFAFLVAIFTVFNATGSLNFEVILANLDAFSDSAVFWAAFLMFIGATGKSAQIPLFVWLPDAMAGPTPVSALIHAATMVTSGIYLITRMSPLYVMTPEVMLIVAVIGALTAIVAATIAITKYDIKGVLAYSTVSQLGFMFLALGSGAYTAALFHVITHAFFKACLFLGSGSVIHTMEGVAKSLKAEGKSDDFDPQDIRNMGGLKKYMPSTYKTFLISTIAIAGLPPLSGFFSKDEIVMHAFSMGIGDYAGVLYMILWGVATITAFLTAFYMFRLTISTFHGTFKLPGRIEGTEGAERHLHESPPTMTLPLWILAILAVVAGAIGLPNFVFGPLGWENWLSNWLAPIAADIPLTLSVATEWVLMMFAIIVAAAAVYTSWRMYSNDGLLEADSRIESRFGSLYGVWQRKYSFDEIYERFIIGPVNRLSDKVLAVFDMKILDGLVNTVAGIVRLSGSLLRYTQTGIVTSYALFFVLGVILVISLILF